MLSQKIHFQNSSIKITPSKIEIIKKKKKKSQNQKMFFKKMHFQSCSLKKHFQNFSVKINNYQKNHFQNYSLKNTF